MTLSNELIDGLLQPIRGFRVKTDNKGMSYLEGYEVIAHLNRVFRFQWDKHVISLDLVFEDFEEKSGRRGWWVCYRATVRLVANGIVKEDVGTGVGPNLPSRADAHDLAVKSAVTDGLKRCAKDWGDQFGLSLYNKGSQDGLVKTVFNETPEPEKALQ